MAIEWAKQNVTGEDIEYLHEIALKMKMAAQELDLNQFYENDLAFHRKIWEISGNKYQAESLERIVVPLFAFFVMKNRRERNSYLASAAKHAQIIEALPTLSVANLRGLMKDSLSCWKTEVLDELLPAESK